MLDRLRSAAVLAAAATLSFSALAAVHPPVAAADWTPTIGRISGGDRYQTATQLSASHFHPGVPVALIASGEDFPDALGAGPAGAALGGPVLLTQKDSLPEITKDELERLQPKRIEVIGGRAVISDAVVTAISALTSGNTIRISQDDRYETAADVAVRTFTNGAATVHIASGLTFPDALSGGAGAGAERGPMLLTLPDQLPTVDVTVLKHLHPTKIVVMGGPGVVSDAVLDALKPYASTVQRRGGADRYETSAIESAAEHAQPGILAVFLATGDTFPDALSSGAVAGLEGAPVLLSHQDCIPQVVDDEINRLQPGFIVVLGGTDSLSDRVKALQVC